VRRALPLVILVATLLVACNVGQPPKFCSVTDEARVAISDVTPDRYASEAAKHVDAVRQAAEELSGAQGTLATKVAEDLEAASKAKGGSMEFTLSYNQFVKDSNDFNHAYCNEPEGP
jgi:vacuolar-type H+-ATPase subunit I/STV1